MNPLAERNAALLRGISRESKVLELGPSMSPIAPRAEGWNVTVVDHATQEELVEKYRSDTSVDVSRIEKVDHVWNGGPLHEAIPEELHGSFDVLIASHVIEHIPDLIGFFDSASRLLHPKTGVMALVVPDKRWCFDCLRQVSTTGQVLQAHRFRLQRHTPATHFDSSAYSAFDGPRANWGREPLPNLYLPDTLEQAYTKFQTWSDDPAAPYVDCHAWQFTPSSFQLLVLELGAGGFCNWHVDWLTPRPVVEFLTQLRPGPETFATARQRDEKRFALMKQILLDLREQIDAQFGSPGVFDQPAREDLQQIAEATNAAKARDEQQFAAMKQMLLEMREHVDNRFDQSAALGFDDQARLELRQTAETAAMVRAALRPSQAVWQGALPIRRVVARLRGRV